MSERHSIGTDRIRATVKNEGAELTSLRDGAGTELLWQAGPEWPRHAPVLFPIVGRLANDTLRHAGTAYRLTQHGFARDSRFEWTERTSSRATLRLQDSEATRALYPFPFVLDMTYVAEGDTLFVTAKVTNPAETVLPCSLGAHPGFVWPLGQGVPKDAHRLEFEAEETGGARRVDGGLLTDEVPLPFDGRVLPLSPDLFAEDALVMPEVRSRAVRYVATGPDGEEVKALTVAWNGYRDLGIWSKPSGAALLCIEPWFGTASPAGCDGEFAQKPGLLLLPPGESRAFTWCVSV